MSVVPSTSQGIQPKFHPIIHGCEVVEAWQWLLTNISNRPSTNNPSHCCIYDQKRWGSHPNLTPLLSSDYTVCKYLARLYITSQLIVNINYILPLVRDGDIQDTGIYTRKIEDSISNLINNKKRFRNSLSEHLAFWVQLAFAAQAFVKFNFSLTPPNYLPEEKGPDGLLLAIGINERARFELRSVKNSKTNPHYLVASAEYRQTGNNPNPNKQLEEFHLISKMGQGTIRLAILIAHAYHSLGMTANEFIHNSILQDSKSYNATIVADDAHACYEMFSCFHYVSSSPVECIATYIGSDNWVKVAEQIRLQVIQILDSAKVL